MDTPPREGVLDRWIRASLENRLVVLAAGVLVLVGHARRRVVLGNPKPLVC